MYVADLSHRTHLGQYVEAATAAINIANALISRGGKRRAPPPPPPPPVFVPPPPPPRPAPAGGGWIMPLALGAGAIGLLTVGMMFGGRRRS